MIRAFFYIFVAVALSLVCAWFAYNPGEVEITFLGYRISTSLVVFLVLLILLFIVIKIVLLPFSLGDVARTLKNNYARKEQQKTLIEYLTVTGEKNTQKYPALAKHISSVFKGETELKNLLLLGITSGIKKAEVLENLASGKGTELLALQHKISDLLALKKSGDALALYKKIFDEYPKAKSIAKPYIDLLSLFEKWDDILRVAKIAFKRGALDKETYLLTASSAMLEKGLSGDDETLVAKAAKICPNNAAAVIAAALNKAKNQRQKKAMRMLSALWKKSPSVDVYNAMCDVLAGLSPYDKIKLISKALQKGKYPAFTNIVLADAYAKASLWGQARELADKYMALYPSSAYGAKVLSEIYAGDNPQSDLALKWKQIAEEKSDTLKGWVCSSCGARYNEWHGVCAKCKSFAAITAFLGGE